MKSRRYNLIEAKGVGQSLRPPIGVARSIWNCRYSDDGGWIANVGVESWWKFPSSIELQSFSLFTLQYKVDSLYQWKRQGSNDVYTFVEQGGKLYYWLGNKGQGSSYAGTIYDDDLVQIDSARHIPKDAEVGTQYVNLGRHLLIINGVDKAILFSGDTVYRSFGFNISTGTPTPIPVQTTYQQGSQLSTGTAIYFSKTSSLGMGRTDGNPNSYGWKVSYIMNTGAESPLSEPSYTDWEIDTAGSGGELKYGVPVQIPLGVEGCVARRLYRTKNIPDNGEQYYFVKQINENASRFIVDIHSDSLLLTPAPSSLASTTISTGYKFGEVWDNRLWLASGNTIIYSNTGIFEQFNALDYFDLGNLVGGDITQLVANYNQLIVFRETSIHIISRTDSGYTISTITASIGTRASNAIERVPGIGIVFLNKQGVWVLSGGLSGGSSLQVQKISQQIDRELESINTAMIHNSISAYSKREKELWIHIPTDSSNVPNMGIVLHLEPTSPAWSFRGDKDKVLAIYSSMGTTLDGYFLLGTVPQWTNSFNVGSINAQMGPLQVLSKSGYWGQTGTVSSTEGNTTFTVTDTAHKGHTWESEWYELSNDASVYRIYSVELEVMSYGDNGFNFSYSTDYSYTNNNTNTQKQARSKTVFTAQEDTVWGPTNAAVTKVPFKPASSTISEGRLIRLRYDVNTELCDQFKFKLESTDNTMFHVLSFSLLYNGADYPVLNQSTRLQRGQPR
jgi:hypothetical protein